VIRAYFNEKATIWDETVAEKDTIKLERMAESLDIKPGSALLDVGTGTGVFVPYLLKRIGRHGRLVTLDFAEEMLKRAWAKDFDGNIEYLHADVTNIPSGDEVFDVVVCYSSFPHFQDKSRSLNEINRVLKKGGKLFICHTSSRNAINGIHRQIPAVQNDVIPSEGEMHTMLSAAGFGDIDICDNGDSYLASARKCSWH
jgi:ubiquinone/menaquinone biosynthesis C-methylase UbiE